MSETVAATVQPVACEKCGQLLWEHGRFVYEGHVFCEECFRYEYVLCPFCNTWVQHDDLEETPDGRSICYRCFQGLCIECWVCGELIPRDDAYYDPEGYSFCEACFFDRYTNCFACGGVVGQEDAVYYRGYPYCPDCAPPSSIHDYGHKPPPEFLKLPFENTAYLGVELELEADGRYPEDVAESALGKLPDPAKDRVYFKEDGSLHNGLEAVFHPTTWKAWHEHMPPTKVLNTFKEAGAVPWNTCGIHVHISRNAFRGRRAINRLALFFWYNKLQLQTLAGRSSSRWAAFCEYSRQDYLLVDYDPNSRYVAVNTATYERTIELRIFRSTTDPREFVAFIQFCDAIVNFVNSFSVLAMRWDVFCEWLRQVNRYHHLVQHMKNKGIWVLD